MFAIVFYRYENDELKPYVEPEQDMSDPKRIEALVCLGFNRYDVENSLDSQKYDDAFATYLLLGRKSTDVSFYKFYVYIEFFIFFDWYSLHNCISYWHIIAGAHISQVSLRVY